MTGGVEMQVKKIFAIALSLMLFLVSIVPVFAEESQTISISEDMQVINIDNEEDDIEIKKKEAKISKDKAVEIAKEALKSYFEYETDEKKFESRIEFREDYRSEGEYSWSIEWRRYEENTSVSIDVWINSDNGTIRSINLREYDRNNGAPTIAQITEEEAKIKAEDFVKRVKPDEYKEAKFEENKYPGFRGNTNYYFNYIRYVNGVPFPNDRISVQVDGLKGKVVGYDYNWHKEVNFPSIDLNIDKEQAEKIMRDNVEMKLRYISSRNRNDYNEKVKEAKLVYNHRFENGSMVDVKEGIMISKREKELEEEKIKDITEERKEEIFKSAKMVTKQAKEISEDRAREIIGKYMSELYGEQYEVDRLRYIEDDDYWRTNGKKAWVANLTKEESFRRRDHGEITIDALTEELIYAHKYDSFDQETEEHESSITWEEGYDKAIEAIDRYFPGKIKDIDTEAKYIKRTSIRNGKKMPELKYYFTFHRKVNGIDYTEDNISIEIDTEEGNIEGLRFRWNDEVNFPEVDKAMDKEEAVEIFFEKNKPELTYTKINNSTDIYNPDWEIKLVYILPYVYQRGNNIDAFTGKFLNYSGEEVSDADNKFRESIKDHESQKELSILASQGIIDTKEFDLEKEVTKIEAIKMLVDAKGYRPYMARRAKELKFSNVKKDDENYKYLQMAVNYGILDNEEVKFDGDDEINKEELAEMLVKLLGHGEIAKLENIFKISYKDAKKVSKDKIGYVAISQGLNIIKDNNGKFEPRDKVKMIDLAIAVYNALGNLK